MMRRAEKAGFTLIEVLVVIAIVGITLAIIVPSAQTSGANKQADKLKEELRLDLMFARNQAITSGAAITISPVSNSWDNGWTIVDDTNQELLTRGSNATPIAESGTITSDDFSNDNPISFDSKGRPLATGTINIAVEGCSGDNAFDIQINLIGQIIISEESCN